MRKLSLIFILLPFLSFAQVSSWRGIPKQSTSTPLPQPSGRVQSTPQINNTSTWRTTPPKNPKQYSSDLTKNPNQYYYNIPNYPANYNRPYMYSTWDPYWGYGRWSRWGAPSYGYSQQFEYTYYNTSNYRQPARVYIYEDGKIDTIRGKKPIINIGIQYSSNNQLGAFFAAGNTIYFTMDFLSTFKPDRSTYFEGGTVDQIDFPLIDDLIKERTFYFGIGKRTGRIGVHGMMGFGSETILWRGKDALGEITFPKSKGSFVTLKVGTLYDIKNFTLKFDMDPLRELVQIGAGVNF